MAIIEEHYSDLVNLNGAFQWSGNKLLYLTMLKQRQKLVNVVFQDWSSSDPQPPTHCEMSLATLDEWRAACAAANEHENLTLWMHTLAKIVQASKHLRRVEKAHFEHICRFGNVAKKLMKEVSHSHGHAAAMTAGQVSSQIVPHNGSVFDLPPSAGVLFQTVSEDVFFRMPLAEREKMSTRPLLIKGCSKLKERLAKVPQLHSQMHHFTEQFSSSLNVQWTGRRRRETSTNKQQPHRQLFTPGHQTHANLCNNHADTRMRATCQGLYSTA